MKLQLIQSCGRKRLRYFRILSIQVPNNSILILFSFLNFFHFVLIFINWFLKDSFWIWLRKVTYSFLMVSEGLVSAAPLPISLLPLSKRLPVLCMEYCSGGDLRQILNKPSNCRGLPEKDILDIMREVSSAVLYLHSVNVIHRDIKPENIVIQLVEGQVYGLSILRVCYY